MLGKRSRQIDIFSSMIYEKLIPKNHLLVLIDSIIDFSFIYDLVKDKYSDVGRKSEDPVVLFKLNLLEYLYVLSDGDVLKRAETDVAFRWFLGLNIDDELPDDTTISVFRTNRIGANGLEDIFNEIVKKCIDKKIIKSKRYIIDSTDVAANVNYPSIKKLICNAFRNVIKEVDKFNSTLAKEELKAFEEEIDREYEKADRVPFSKFCEIGIKHAQYLYLKTYDHLQMDSKYIDVFSIFWDIVEQYSNSSSKDKIISCVDPDARVAHKSPGNKKRGYKDHIIVDEDSEIILSSTQTPFNVGDEKELKSLIEKVEENFGLKPEEISADKVYGTNDNRAFLKDNEIISNIDFYDTSGVEYAKFDLRKFKISEDMKSVECPNNVISKKCTVSKDNTFIWVTFDKNACKNCPLRVQCLGEKDAQNVNAVRRLKISTKYDAIVNDLNRISTDEFKVARNKRNKIERRFATMVLNHGLRRSRFLRLNGAKIHIILANTACNIVRMVNILTKNNQPGFAIAKMA